VRCALCSGLAGLRGRSEANRLGASAQADLGLNWRFIVAAFYEWGAADATQNLFMTLTDTLLSAADGALRTLFAAPRARRPNPAAALAPVELSQADKAEAGALMRVNHVGEVCAQALYAAQALSTRNPALRRHFEQAGREEEDHLAWTHQRLEELGARPSLLNPLWYAGAFGLGLAAGRIGDGVSLGFLQETERQVEAHLASHLDRLPAADQPSRAIVAKMMDDEARHASDAGKAGALPLPWPVQALMKASAKVMTTTAQRV
jgi:3-demethoxyubiquinol 3-hydroxylase